jgi:hypothetical protein
MQRLASSRRLLQAALAPAPARANSSLSAAAVAVAVAAPTPENGAAAVPKMPAFDYTPPPYDGPRAEEIFRKRAQFLSPSLFHFYDRPVRLPLPHRHSSLHFSGKDQIATTEKKNEKKNCKLSSDFTSFFG